MSKYQPKHARPKKRRGNKYTPAIHSVAIILAFFFVADNISRISNTTNEWAGLAKAIGLLVVLEIAFALAISIGCVIYFERKANKSKRVEKRIRKEW